MLDPGQRMSRVPCQNNPCLRIDLAINPSPLLFGPVQSAVLLEILFRKRGQTIVWTQTDNCRWHFCLFFWPRSLETWGQRPSCHSAERACLKIQRGPVFVERAVWQGATSAHTRMGLTGASRAVGAWSFPYLYPSCSTLCFRLTGSAVPAGLEGFFGRRTHL